MPPFLNLWCRLRPQESCASCVLAALAQARHCSCLSSNQSVVLCFFFKLRAAAIGAVLGHSHPARESHGATGSHRDRDRNGANVRYISRVLYPEQISVGVPGPIRPRPRGWELESQIRRPPPSPPRGSAFTSLRCHRNRYLLGERRQGPSSFVQSI